MSQEISVFLLILAKFILIYVNFPFTSSDNTFFIFCQVPHNSIRFLDFPASIYIHYISVGILWNSREILQLNSESPVNNIISQNNSPLPTFLSNPLIATIHSSTPLALETWKWTYANTVPSRIGIQMREKSSLFLLWRTRIYNSSARTRRAWPNPAVFYLAASATNSKAEERGREFRLGCVDARAVCARDDVRSSVRWYEIWLSSCREIEVQCSVT